MHNLVYLLIVVGLSALGLFVLWLRNRPPASSPRSSIEEFHGKMRALAPDDPDQESSVSRSGRDGRGA